MILVQLIIIKYGMNRFDILLMALFSISFLHCTKQAQKVTSLVGNTTSSVLADNVDSLVADSITGGVLTSKIKIFDPNYDTDLVQYLEGEGHQVKATYTFDEQRRAGVILDFDGDKRWLFRTLKDNQSSIFSDEGIGWRLTSIGDRATLVIKNDTYNLKVK